MVAQEWLGIATTLSFDSSIETNWYSAGAPIEQFRRRAACSVLNVEKLRVLLEALCIDRLRSVHLSTLSFLLSASPWL